MHTNQVNLELHFNETRLLWFVTLIISFDFILNRHDFKWQTTYSTLVLENGLHQLSLILDIAPSLLFRTLQHN